MGRPRFARSLPEPLPFARNQPASLPLARFFTGPDPRYVCAVASLPNLRRLRVTSDAVPKILHLTSLSLSANIEVVRSFCEVSDPGLNVPSRLHMGLPWFNFLDGTRDVTVLLNANVMSVKIRNCHGGVSTVDVKDNPHRAHGLDDVMPPRYSPLLINTFDTMPRLASLKLASSLSIVIPEDARSTLLYCRRRLYQPRMASPAAKPRKSSVYLYAPPLCPAFHPGGHHFVIEFHDDVPEVEECCRHHRHSSR